MKRDIIRLPQCHVAYNIMYNANVPVYIHMDMYIKGCKHCVHMTKIMVMYAYSLLYQYGHEVCSVWNEYTQSYGCVHNASSMSPYCVSNVTNVDGV